MKKGRKNRVDFERLIEIQLKEIKELKAENKKLRDRVDYLIRQLFGRKSEKIDPRQMLLLLGLEESPAEEIASEDEPRPEAPVRGKKKRRQLKDRLPEDLPVRITVVDPPEVSEAPGDYRYIGEETHDELSMTPPKYFVKRTVRRKFVNKADKAAPPVIVPAEPRLIDNSFASPELLADIIMKKYADHLPLDRQSKILKRDHGIEISRKTMCGWMQKAAFWLSQPYEQLKEDIRATGYMQADETCIKYIDPGGGKTKNGYLWAYRGNGVGILFEWYTGRSAAYLASMVSDYTGDLQCDGYQAYRTFNKDKEDKYVLYACWAHARRKFYNARNESEAAAEILRKIQCLYKIETELRQSKADEDTRLAYRQEHSKDILVDIEEQLKEELPNHRPSSLTGKAIEYTLKLWDELVRFADTGHIEIDNNKVENSIRPTAVGKKNWLFFGSPTSGQSSAILYSLLETCRMVGADPREYLQDMFNRLPAMSASEARMLTPARWLKQKSVAAA